MPGTLIVMMVSLVYAQVQMHQNVCIKNAQFLIYQLCLNTVVK